jgi:hypothetical protein
VFITDPYFHIKAIPITTTLTKVPLLWVEAKALLVHRREQKMDAAYIKYPSMLRVCRLFEV